ncbi:MAG: insulinase family protein [Betaproteobacteria bacterium]|nr:insulinase family protein [Betaproteobacteria bacterium]
MFQDKKAVFCIPQKLSWAHLTATTFCTLALAMPTAKALAQSGGGGALINARPAVQSKPVPLNWRSIVWPSLNFNRTAVDGGAALYSIFGETGKKIRLDFLFETGVYALPRNLRTNLSATVDMFLQGGAGTRNYEELQKYLADNGIQVTTSVSSVGQFHVAVEVLAPDFLLAMSALEDMLLRPRFDRDALEIWKMEQTDAFQGMLDGGNSRKQGRFIEQEAIRLAFGSEHYFAQALARTSKPELEKVTAEKMRQIAGLLVNRAGLNVVLSGNINAKQEQSVLQLMRKIPRLTPITYSWLPDRVRGAGSNKLRLSIIRKPDLSQATLTLRYYLPAIGKLNRIERTRMTILREVFSASGGVIGNDRFSKAMRSDSGLSYGPYASFDPEAIEPNTNTGVWRMNFQSPNERIVEAVKLATKTWETFASKGITQDELDSARISRINTTLATEQTVFDKVDDFIDDLQAKVLPNPLGLESALVRLEQEKDLATINNLLFSQVSAGTVPVLVMMGNPSEAAVKELRSIPGVEIAKEVNFEDLVKELVSGGPK